MYSQLLLALALAVVVLGQNKSLNLQLFKELSTNERFYAYYEKHTYDEQLDQNDESFAQYMLDTLGRFRQWKLRLSDFSSKEYRDLVAAQHGSTFVSTDDQVLLKQYLESLYHADEVAENNTNSSTINNNWSSTNSSTITTTTTNTTNIFSELESLIRRFGIPKPIPPKPLTPEEREKARLEALKASYSFETEVDNNMEGNYFGQIETRRNGKVYGKYSFDDLNNFVTRYYIADENGFRIVKEIVLPSKKAGQQLNGRASVQVNQNGANTAYQITEEDVKKCKYLQPVPQ